MARASQPQELLKRVVDQTMKIPPDKGRAELVSCAAILAGLRFDKELIKKYFPEELMQESVIYQEIIQRGIMLGREEGRGEGREEGREEGKLEMILRQLAHRFGEIALDTRAQVEKLSASLLDDLGEALLDFQNESDLQDWLARNAE